MSKGIAYGCGKCGPDERTIIGYTQEDVEDHVRDEHPDEYAGSDGLVEFIEKNIWEENIPDETICELGDEWWLTVEDVQAWIKEIEQEKKEWDRMYGGELISDPVKSAKTFIDVKLGFLDRLLEKKSKSEDEGAYWKV